jgi:hypothetical protein
MGRDLILLIISGAGVVLWYFVITLIADLKKSNEKTYGLMIEIDKNVVEIRVKLSNADKEIDALWQEIHNIKQELRR